MNTGIYEIRNTVNGKWYRGQTAKTGFKGRWRDHRRDLNKGKHVNQHLQNAWDKYGEGAFKFSVLSRCTPEFCNELEEYWIGEDYQCSDVSYNKKAGGDNGMHSDETRCKIGDGCRGEKHYRYTPFTVTWLDGRTDHWETIREAAAHYGVGRNTICRYLKGTHIPGTYKTTAHLKGCIFEYITQ